MFKPLLFFCFTCLSFLSLGQADTFMNMRVVWIENPQHEVTLIWDSEKKSSKDKVIFTDSEGKEQVVYSTPPKAYTHIDKRGNTIDGDPFYYRHVKIRGLSPNQSYSFKAYSDDDESEAYQFSTAPQGLDYKLVFVGDSRTRVEVAAKVSEQIQELREKESKIIAVLHGGDYANSPVLKDWKPWLKAYSNTTSKDRRLMPIIPVCGNHENIKRSQLYGEAYGYPGEIKKYYYTCRLSDQVRIAILNTEISTLGPQQDFLKGELEAYRSDKIKWQLAAYHKPAFPAIKKPSSAMTSFVPLFDEYGLDLSLESDGHCIKRTVAIKDNKPNHKGTVYLGEGGYGAPQRTPKEKWYLDSPGMASSGDHLMLLHFKEDSIDYKTIGIKGDILDEYAFRPRSR